MKLNKLKITVVFLTIFTIIACQTDYTKLVKKELLSGVKYNSVFYGIKFNQTKKEFYKICWNLNKQGIATHGPSNSYVQTILYPKDTLQKKPKIRLLFYPKFSKEEKIKAIDIKFSYLAWAPWNKQLQADKLLPVIKDTLLKWYPGNKFLKTKKGILVKIDGNRQIQLQQESEQNVSVLIEDLEYKYNTIINTK